MSKIKHLKTISEFHRTRGLSQPKHPLISVVNYADIKLLPKYINASWMFDFYSIALKRNLNGKINYGQKEYDFEEGVLFFISPGQVFSIDPKVITSNEKSGWIMLVHPDFLWNTTLAKEIKQYEYFGYAVNEALFLSKKEENTVAGIIKNIQQEYHSNIDKFSQQIIVSQLLSLLNYAERFYQRNLLQETLITIKY
ncbi:hypothetical protein C7447_101802 [Tenacibaculum adriaticum]|uniref:AraC family transcriptional regulator n=1 Tax=Tenacibaculum adriaticum TaxID=413713 RepID=A0A5S5DWG3_9FLAO|nr:hypothetical protein [Tenacibaculum adriaticum]TYQ00192.1 hypothetical protein C7447_101802 [Tenacibaculum adriaticum]